MELCKENVSYFSSGLLNAVLQEMNCADAIPRNFHQGSQQFTCAERDITGTRRGRGEIPPAPSGRGWKIAGASFPSR
jgi:hypothetical protein